MIEKIKDLFKNNRVFRTFVQSFIGYIVANLAFALEQVITGSGEAWYKVLLTTLLIPALATALSAIMNRTPSSGEEEEVSTVGDSSEKTKVELIAAIVNAGKYCTAKMSKETLLQILEDNAYGGEKG